MNQVSEVLGKVASRRIRAAASEWHCRITDIGMGYADGYMSRDGFMDVRVAVRDVAMDEFPDEFGGYGFHANVTYSVPDGDRPWKSAWECKIGFEWRQGGRQTKTPSLLVFDRQQKSNGGDEDGSGLASFIALLMPYSACIDMEDAARLDNERTGTMASKGMGSRSRRMTSSTGDYIAFDRVSDESYTGETSDGAYKVDVFLTDDLSWCWEAYTQDGAYADSEAGFYGVFSCLKDLCKKLGYEVQDGRVFSSARKRNAGAKRAAGYSDMRPAGYVLTCRSGEIDFPVFARNISELDGYIMDFDTSDPDSDETMDDMRIERLDDLLNQVTETGEGSITDPDLDVFSVYSPIKLHPHTSASHATKNGRTASNHTKGTHRERKSAMASMNRRRNSLRSARRRTASNDGFGFNGDSAYMVWFGDYAIECDADRNMDGVWHVEYDLLDPLDPENNTALYRLGKFDVDLSGADYEEDALAGFMEDNIPNISRKEMDEYQLRETVSYIMNDYGHFRGIDTRQDVIDGYVEAYGKEPSDAELDEIIDCIDRNYFVHIASRRAKRVSGDNRRRGASRDARRMPMGKSAHVHDIPSGFGGGYIETDCVEPGKWRARGVQGGEYATQAVYGRTERSAVQKAVSEMRQYADSRGLTVEDVLDRKAGKRSSFKRSAAKNARCGKGGTAGKSARAMRIASYGGRKSEGGRR